MGYLKLPEGKRIAVNLGVDVDAQSLWLGGFNRPSPSFMSREFAHVGVPRLLKLFKENNIKLPFYSRTQLWHHLPSRKSAKSDFLMPGMKSLLTMAGPS